MNGHCSTCGRPLKDTVAVDLAKPGSKPQKFKVCKSPICKQYNQPQEWKK